MQVKEFNTDLRHLIDKLIKDGYKKAPLCSITLGSQANPQFEKFLKGTDLGAIPLSRIVSNISYELHLVPIAKDNTELLDYINKLTEQFFDTTKENIQNFMENKTSSPRIIKENSNKQLIETQFKVIFGDIFDKNKQPIAIEE